MNTLWCEGLQDIINQHSELLFKKHRNLNMVSASPVKSQQEGNIIEPHTCIVFYCSRKGLIPSDEKPFPKFLGGVMTDVREGFFRFSSPDQFLDERRTYDAKYYQNPLRVGCSISKNGVKKFGTLGGFVQDSINQDVKGFLTCSHVLNLPTTHVPDSPRSTEEMESSSWTQFRSKFLSLFTKSKTTGSNPNKADSGQEGNRRKFAEGETSSQNAASAADLSTPSSSDVEHTDRVEIMQPSDFHYKLNSRKGQDTANQDNNRNCGYVDKHIFQSKSANGYRYFLDAAFVRVDKRDIENGEFVELDDDVLCNLELSDQFPITEDEFNFNVTDLGEVSPDNKNLAVYKCGCSTGITRGDLLFNGAAVRIREAVDANTTEDEQFKVDGISFVSNNMIEITDYHFGESFHHFAEEGDSGSLVFSVSYENGEKRTKVIGMLMGRNTLAASYVAMPIDPILQSLNLRLSQFP